MQEDGYVAALLYPEGAKDVPLGEIISVLVEDKKDIPAFANYTASAAKSAPKASTQETQPSSQPTPA